MGKEPLELDYAALLKVARLQQLQDRIGSVVGLSTLVTDPGGRPITRVSNLCSFCAIVNTTDEGRGRCEAWQAELARAVTASGQRQMEVCHAGLVYLAVPVKVKGETIAVAMGGNVALASLQKRKTVKLAGELGLGKEKLLAAARAVPIWPEKRFQDAAELFYVLVDALVQLSYSRQELQQQEKELSALVEFSRTVSSTLRVSEVASRALEAVLGLIGATSGSVVMLSEEVPGVTSSEVAAAMEPGSELRMIPRGEVVAVVAREGMAVHFDSHPEGKTAEERRPAVSVPLTVGGDVTGVLTLAGKPEGATFGKDEVRFLTVLGAGLALALENARLFRELERKAAMLEHLNEVGQVVSSSFDIDVILESALRSAKAISGAEWCVLRLLDKQTGKMVVKARLGFSEDSKDKPERVQVEGTVLDEVFRTGQPAAVEDLAACDRSLCFPCYTEEMRAAAAVPVRALGEVLGALEVFLSSPHQWKEEELGYLATLAAQTGVAVANARLYESLRESYRNAVRALASALEAKDVYTGGHSLRVAHQAKACAREMGLMEEEQEHVYLAGLLHDIGKIGVREEILLKAGALSPEERKEIESHPVVGARILEPAKFPREVIEAVRYHHEDYGGGGYPEGIVGEEIPILARIIRVSDAYDAITSERPYRKAYPRDWAVMELQRCMGKQFDPDVVRAFLAVVERRGREIEEMFEGGA
ncbi:MAG: HD domain-containing phosphohydrolase [Bacillota bacterium]